MRQPQWLHNVPVHNTLGESVLWHPQQEALWWTDIHRCRLYRYAFNPACWAEAKPASGQLTEWHTPERLAAFGFVPGDGPQRLIAAFDRGFALYTPETGDCQWLAQPEAHQPAHRFNDGKMDRQGRFWAGTMVEQGDPLAGEGAALYSWSGASGVQRHVRGLGISNGLSWSPDSRTAYLSDSARGEYYAYDFEAISGQLSNRRVWARTPEGVGHDGACVDADGNVWSAHFGGGRVVCYAPSGEQRLALEVPVSQPTCVAFGGPDLSWLCVTTARENLSEQQLANEPEAGNVLIYQTDVKGLPADFFDERYSASTSITAE